MKESIVKKMGLNFQPHVSVVSEDITDIGNSESSVLAVIQSNLYFQVPSIVAGINICFKACFVFHLGYGNAAKSSWHFLQKSVFSIDTEHDSDNTTVLQLMADIIQTLTLKSKFFVTHVVPHSFYRFVLKRIIFNLFRSESFFSISY
jgi:hypothetical protein